MINFTRAFDSAWERMVIILFRPFDIGKWFLIGLSAFLAGLLQGGNGVNGGSFNNVPNVNNPSVDVSHQSLNLHRFMNDALHTMLGLKLAALILLGAALFTFIILFSLLLLWLGTRGQFLFLDNIARNRGSIGWPWSHYSRQANSLFGLYVLFMVISFLVIIPVLVIAVVMSIPYYHQNRWPIGGEYVGFAVLGLIYFAFTLVFMFVLFIFREFGVPMMFRNGLMARPAFIESMSLVSRHPGSIALFVLLRIALNIAVGIVSILTCCCCVGVIPYLGTVALLPALIYVRCFTLDCLAQFGPQYDVWTVDVPFTGTVPPSITLPPPLG